MAKTEDIAAGAADWTERILSSGWKLCVDGEGVLHVSDGEGWMFMAPLRKVRQVEWGPRSERLDGLYPTDRYPLNVTLFYGEQAYFSFVCAEEDLATVRFIFDGRPLVDFAEKMRRFVDENRSG